MIVGDSQNKGEISVWTDWFQSLCNTAFFLIGGGCSVIQSFLTLQSHAWTVVHQASLSFIISQSLLKLTSIESVMLLNHFILFCPLLLLPSVFPSIRVFSKESALHIRWPKYWSFSISPFNEYSELISFRMDWLDLLAVKETLKSLHQHHSSKAWILRRSAFFLVQVSHPYMINGKTIALTVWTFVSKVTSLLLNTLSRFVVAFLLRSLLILWLQSWLDYSVNKILPKHSSKLYFHSHQFHLLQTLSWLSET